MCMRCYRYMKFDRAEQSLKTQFFKVSRPSDFNDPFECRGRIVNVEVPLRKYVHENLERLRNEAIVKSMAAGTIRAEEQSVFTEEILFQQYVETTKREIDDESLRVADTLLLMMCLVLEKGLKPDSDVLFWSHYADAGQGVRVTLDLPKKSRAHYMCPVDYSKELPIFDAAEMDGWMKGEKFKSFIERLTHTKGEAWKYEHEIRMIIPRNLPYALPDNKKHVRQIIVKGRPLEFVRVDPSVVRRVDFGPRVDKAKAAKLVCDLRKSSEYSHVHFFETMFDDAKYAYQYKRVA